MSSAIGAGGGSRAHDRLQERGAAHGGSGGLLIRHQIAKAHLAALVISSPACS
jgi:hypothetical protein